MEFEKAVAKLKRVCEALGGTFKRGEHYYDTYEVGGGLFEEFATCSLRKGRDDSKEFFHIVVRATDYPGEETLDIDETVFAPISSTTRLRISLADVEDISYSTYPYSREIRIKTKKGEIIYSRRDKEHELTIHI